MTLLWLQIFTELLILSWSELLLAHKSKQKVIWFIVLLMNPPLHHQPPKLDLGAQHVFFVRIPRDAEVHIQVKVTIWQFDRVKISWPFSLPVFLENHPSTGETTAQLLSYTQPEPEKVKFEKTTSTFWDFCSIILTEPLVIYKTSQFCSSWQALFGGFEVYYLQTSPQKARPFCTQPLCPQPKVVGSLISAIRFLCSNSVGLVNSSTAVIHDSKKPGKFGSFASVRCFWRAKAGEYPETLRNKVRWFPKTSWNLGVWNKTKPVWWQWKECCEHMCNFFE